MNTTKHAAVANMTAEGIADWRSVKIHFGKKAGTKLGDLSQRDLRWWKENWQPNSQFCKSKLSQKFEIPAHESDAGYEDDDGYWIAGEKILVPASIGQRRIADPANCPDCALRAALNAASFEAPKVVAAATESKAEGEGEKVTVSGSVEKVFDVEKEFNRKKTVTTVAILRDGENRVFKFNVPAAAALKVGDEITASATVNFHGEFEGEKYTALSRPKIAGVVKLAPTHGIELFCDAKSREDRIAVCGADGQVLEYRKAGLGRPDNGDNTDHELAGAMLALDIARRAKESAGLDCIAVTLSFDAQWMKGMVGKAKPLRDFAKTHGLIVKMNQIAGTENPADEWTTAIGSRAIESENELTALVAKL